MKRIFIAMLVSMQVLTAAAYAEGDDFLPENDTVDTAVTDIQPAAEVSAPVSNTFTANFTVEGEGLNDEKTLTFGLYDGASLVCERSYNISADERAFSVVFDVPQYEIGKQFTLACTGGAYGIRYYDDFYDVGQGAPAPTYAYTDEYGTNVVVDSTAVNVLTIKQKKINLYVDGKQLSLKSQPRLIDGTIMVPIRETAEALGVFDVTYNAQYNSVRVSPISGKELLFNIGYPWTTVNGVNRVDSAATQYVGGSVYAPLSTLANGVASEIEAWEHDAYYDILLGRSQYIIDYVDKVNYITGQKLTSSTDYLIWISKANYEVNVFKKSGGVWNFVNSYKCAIGASSSPTCVGTYRYYEKISRWTYPEFYVGPVMRFNGGYAIHSTLLNYDGTDYNRTVGKKLSHGCVRVQPPDMDWLINNIPMYTTVHVTEI
jgi:hypothetical protein